MSNTRKGLETKVNGTVNRFYLNTRTVKFLENIPEKYAFAFQEAFTNKFFYGTSLYKFLIGKNLHEYKRDTTFNQQEWESIFLRCVFDLLQSYVFDKNWPRPDAENLLLIYKVLFNADFDAAREELLSIIIKLELAFVTEDYKLVGGTWHPIDYDFIDKIKTFIIDSSADNVIHLVARVMWKFFELQRIIEKKNIIVLLINEFYRSSFLSNNLWNEYINADFQLSLLYPYSDSVLSEELKNGLLFYKKEVIFFIENVLAKCIFNRFSGLDLLNNFFIKDVSKIVMDYTNTERVYDKFTERVYDKLMLTKVVYEEKEILFIDWIYKHYKSPSYPHFKFNQMLKNLSLEKEELKADELGSLRGYIEQYKKTPALDDPAVQRIEQKCQEEKEKLPHENLQKLQIAETYFKKMGEMKQAAFTEGSSQEIIQKINTCLKDLSALNGFKDAILRLKIKIEESKIISNPKEFEEKIKALEKLRINAYEKQSQQLQHVYNNLSNPHDYSTVLKELLDSNLFTVNVDFILFLLKLINESSKPNHCDLRAHEVKKKEKAVWLLDHLLPKITSLKEIEKFTQLLEDKSESFKFLRKSDRTWNPAFLKKIQQKTRELVHEASHSSSVNLDDLDLEKVSTLINIHSQIKKTFFDKMKMGFFDKASDQEIMEDKIALYEWGELDQCKKEKALARSYH